MYITEQLQAGRLNPSALFMRDKDGHPPSNLPMEMALAQAVKVNPDFRVDVSSTFPYHNVIDGVEQFVHFRRNFRARQLLFSIDIGVISEDGTSFNSNGFIDFSVGKVYGIRSEKSVGIASYIHDDPPLSGTIPVHRPSIHDSGYAALFVKDFWRGNSMGRSLKDGAVAVLREQPINDSGEKVRFLVFEDISDLRFGTQPGDFYSAIRGRVRNRYVDKNGRQRGRMIVPINVASTARDPFKS